MFLIDDSYCSLLVNNLRTTSLIWCGKWGWEKSTIIDNRNESTVMRESDKGGKFRSQGIETNQGMH